MQTRILKFGGSSLTSLDQFGVAASRVNRTASSGRTPLVVVSAMSGLTNRLLNTARQLHPDPPGEELDVLLATGEAQAASMMALALQRIGLRARSFTGLEAGIITDACFGRARILDVKRSPLAAALAAGEIPVVSGFQGSTRDGQVTTLGRGGSDITAIALGVAHDAERIVFYRDVDGIHSTDPKLLAATRRLDRLDYDAMMDLAEAGVPILHPQALETARAHGLTLEVRGLGDRDGRTLISGDPSPCALPVWSVSLSHPMSMFTVDAMPRDVHMLARLVALLDRTDLRLEGDLQPAESRGVCFSLLLPEIEASTVRAQVEDFLREEAGLRFSLERRRQRVTLVGKGVKSRRVSRAIEGIAARLGPPLATYWGEHHRAFVVPEGEGRSWLSSLHQDLIRR